MTKSIIVKSIRNKGKGVFSLKDFKKDEFIFRSTKGKLIKRQNISKLSRKEQNHTTEIKSNIYELMISPAKYINHSCDPNSYVKGKFYYAMKPIKEGEEITVDYRIGTRDRWEMKCKCGSKKCSKIVIGDFFTLKKNLQRKYLNYLPIWFKKEFSNKLKNLNIKS